MLKKFFSLLLVGFMLSICSVEAAVTEKQEQSMQKAWESVVASRKAGPAEFLLGKQGKINLPQGFYFVPKKQADSLMKAMGNSSDPEMVGMIMPENDEEDWFIIIDYIDSGYIKDDDAKNWDIEEMLQSVKDGTKEGNKEREAKGFPGLEVIGWVEKPKYDSVNKRLIWSMSSREKGVKTLPEEQTINYNTYVLGRQGYLNLILVTDMGHINSLKPLAEKILSSTEFVQGKRYQDFDASVDKVAEYGLAGLIAGVAAKKLGLFAIVAAFFVKFAKVIVVAVVAVGALVTKLFLGKKSNDQPEDKDTQPPDM